MAMDHSDELDLDQQVLTDEQETTEDVGSVPQGPTTQELEEKVRLLTAETRGLQSYLGKAADAIRADYDARFEAFQQSAMEQLRAQQDQQATREFLDGLDEDQRPMAEVLLNRINQVQQSVPQVAPQPESTPVHQDPTQQILQAWQPVVEWTEGMGIPRSDPRIQWTLMADSNSLPDQAKMHAFRDHIALLRAQDLAPAPPPTRGDDPPVQGNGRAASGGELRTADAIRDAYIEGRIGTSDYQERMRAIGESV